MTAAVTARLTDGHIDVRVAAMYAIPQLVEKGNAAAIAALEALLRRDTVAILDDFSRVKQVLSRATVSRLKRTALEILEKIANEADIQRIHADLDVDNITRFSTLPLPLSTSYRRRMAEHFDLREPRETWMVDPASAGGLRI